MVIAVEKGLDAMKSYLSERGFQVVDLDSSQVFDAAVYENLGFFNIPTPNQVTAKAGTGQAGTFLVWSGQNAPRGRNHASPKSLRQSLLNLVDFVVEFHTFLVYNRNKVKFNKLTNTGVLKI